MWDENCNRVGLAWVMPKRIVDLVTNSGGLQGSKKIAAAWKMTAIFLMSCIWRARNDICFEDC